MNSQPTTTSRLDSLSLHDRKIVEALGVSLIEDDRNTLSVRGTNSDEKWGVIDDLQAGTFKRQFFEGVMMHVKFHSDYGATRKNGFIVKENVGYFRGELIIDQFSDDGHLDYSNMTAHKLPKRVAYDHSHQRFIYADSGEHIKDCRFLFLRRNGDAFVFE